MPSHSKKDMLRRARKNLGGTYTQTPDGEIVEQWWQAVTDKKEIRQRTQCVGMNLQESVNEMCRRCVADNTGITRTSIVSKVIAGCTNYSCPLWQHRPILERARSHLNRALIDEMYPDKNEPYVDPLGLEDIDE